MTSDLARSPRPTPLAAAVGVITSPLGTVLVWFVPIVLLVPVALYTFLTAVGLTLDATDVAWGVAHNAPAWFLFAMAASLVPRHLPVAVAHGMTRRLLATALSWALLAAAALLALVVPVALGVEAWVLGALGWTLDAGSVPPATLAGVLVLVGNAFLRFAAMGAIGALAAVTYYRAGAWWGSLLAPLSVALPGIAVLYVFGERGAWIEPGPRTVLVVATIVLTTLAYHALLRGATVRGKAP